MTMKLKRENWNSRIRTSRLGIIMPIIFTLILMNILALPANSLTGSSSTESQPMWTTAANMITPRTDGTGTKLNENVYVIGGFNNKGKSSYKVEYYDPKTNIWNMAPTLPLPLDHAASATYNGSLYVVGGYRSSNVPATIPSDKLFIYNSLNNSWREGKPMPQARGALTAQFINGTLYAVGGVGKSGVTDNNTAYDTRTNTWTEKAPMPTAREHLSSAVVDGKMYVMGGRVADLQHNLNANEVYNPINDSWSSLVPMPSKRGGLAAAATADGDIYVFGGEEPGGTFNNNEKYDPKTNKWTVESPMSTARHGLSAVTVGDKIYVIGGGPEPGLIVGGVNEIYEPRVGNPQ